MVRVSDLLPQSSGSSSLGVNQSAGDAFDIASITPFSHLHLNSGVFHGSLGQSGVVRYNQTVPSFQVSLDGGLTFNDLVTGATVVISVGVLGDVNLTGNVDFASPASGFIVNEDSSNASPLLWSVNTLALSGLWGFPANGFSHFPQCFAKTFTPTTTWTVTHSLNTADVSVSVFDDSTPRVAIIPDSIAITNVNTVTITFNTSQGGRVIIVACL